MRRWLMACAALCAACSGVGGDPLDDGGTGDAVNDRKLGAILDASKDAAPSADADGDASCPFAVADPNVLHAQCYPVIDSKCAAASACGAYAYHYACETNNTPPTNLDCLSVGGDDFCCVQSACVPDVGNANANCEKANCLGEDGGWPNEVACPTDMAPSSSCGSSVNDAGVIWTCVK